MPTVVVLQLFAVLASAASADGTTSVALDGDSEMVAAVERSLAFRGVRVVAFAEGKRALHRGYHLTVAIEHHRRGSIRGSCGRQDGEKLQDDHGGHGIKSTGRGRFSPAKIGLAQTSPGPTIARAASTKAAPKVMLRRIHKLGSLWPR